MSATLPDLSQVGEAVPPFANDLRKIGQGGGFGFEGWDGFDEAGDREGIADAAGTTDEAENAAFAGEFDRNAHQRGDAGAIDLWDAVQDDDNFLCAAFDDRFESVVKLLGGLADGKPTVDFEHRHPSGCADVDFHGQTVSHGGTSTYPMWAAMAIHDAARHYTLASKLDKVVGQIKADKEEPFQKFTGPIRQASRERCIRKTNPGYENFNLRQGVGMRIMLGGKVAGPRKSNPEPAERTHL